MSDPLPAPADRRIAVRVTRDALKHIRRGHPWLFDASITSHSHEGAPGDLAVIFDDKRKFAAIGLWDPDSVIRVRVLHRGEPRTIDDAFWDDRLERCEARRARLLHDPDTTGIRLVHGENDDLPGLVIDRYGDVIVVKLYTDAWFPHLRAVTRGAIERWNPAGIVLRLARSVAPRAPDGFTDGTVIHGTVPHGPVPFRENGLTFHADPVAGQKTGYFLDQRANRRLVATDAAEARLLDVFCCHGGFATHAAAAGARFVHAVDLSPHAAASAEGHLVANAPDVPRRTTVGDAFVVMADLAAAGERYDIVVVDPPSFAARRDAMAGALRAYTRLTHLALDLLEPGGTLLQASCSSRVDASSFEAGVRAAATRAGRPLRDVTVTGHDDDHPIGFPEGAYLKAVIATVDG